MALKIEYAPYRLFFKQPAITSRSVMHDKETYFVRLHDTDVPGVYGMGECAIFRGLCSDDTPDYEARLNKLCRLINMGEISMSEALMLASSSVRFGLETAFADFMSGGLMKPFASPWSEGCTSIIINGLVWMGTATQMRDRIAEKINAGFRCIKLKIGGINFDQELELVKFIRKSFPSDKLEIRLDANGAFTADNALKRLDALFPYDIHSIEQPIRHGQFKEMAGICKQSPIPIALDEELIGTFSNDYKLSLLGEIKPQYIVLKPSLCGGFSDADNWISVAESIGIKWWATSALESNIGLNAIAQWTACHDTKVPQGLGTGALYTNNIVSPLVQSGQSLRYDVSKQWNIPDLNWLK